MIERDEPMVDRGAAAATARVAPNAVEIDNLTISYRRRRQRLDVVSGLSFHIRPREAYGLVGESGCGKTTVAMALMRYLPPNAIVESGHILFDGEDVLSMPDTRLRRLRGNRMAMVYQDPGSSLNPCMRVGPQVAEVYRQHRGLGSRQALDQAEGMLERVQITDPRKVMRRYPHELSGGQQQRVVIAMALATDPELLVLDEPTTGLDATVEAGVLDLVEQLRDECNASILFISHNLAVVGRVCDRVGVLYAGRLIEEGAAREIFAAPGHPYSLALLRCLPRLGMRKDTTRFDPIPGSLPPLGAEIPGCVYADRCPIVRDRCRVDRPLLAYATGAHVAACHYSAEVPHISPTAASNPAVTTTKQHDPLLKVDDLAKSYRSAGDDIAALSGVSFEVGRGETFGLVGESGCGKSTLAKVLVGLTDSSRGTIEFDASDVSATSQRTSRALRQQVQMVFQDPDNALNPHHSVRRILGRALNRLAGIRSGRAQHERMVQLARSVRLEPRHLEARPTTLSGGLKQRVAIAHAFAGRPRLVICDEPVSALDVSVQAAILNLLVDLQVEQDVSYVFISHDLALVRYLADRIGVMYLGQLVEVGTAEAVFSPPHHPYTEALASATPTLDSGERRRRIKLEGPLPSPADPPAGCRFHTRCPRYIGDICRTQEPPWRDTGAGNMYRCHIPPEVLGEVQLSARDG
jgi:peptide/nickel transport system ATP-binding protein